MEYRCVMMKGVGGHRGSLEFECFLGEDGSYSRRNRDALDEDDCTVQIVRLIDVEAACGESATMMMGSSQSLGRVLALEKHTVEIWDQHEF